MTKLEFKNIARAVVSQKHESAMALLAQIRNSIPELKTAQSFVDCEEYVALVVKMGSRRKTESKVAQGTYIYSYVGKNDATELRCVSVIPKSAFDAMRVAEIRAEYAASQAIAPNCIQCNASVENATGDCALCDVCAYRNDMLSVMDIYEG